MAVKCINNKPLEGNNIGPSLELGKKYEIIKEITCKCGQRHYDVGLVSHLNWVECYKCRETLPNGNKIHWCNSIRFE